MRKTTGSSFMKKDRRTVGWKDSKDRRTVGRKDSRIEGWKEEVDPKGIKGKWWRRNAF